MSIRISFFASVLSSLFVFSAFAHNSESHKAALSRTASPADAKLYFIAPANGAKIKGPVTVRFGLKNMGVAPAGVASKDTGHHHLLIDTPLPNLALPIPADDKHKHFGGGQTETTLDLPPGRHTLQLLLADHNHIPHLPPVVSEVIEITITK